MRPAIYVSISSTPDDCQCKGCIYPDGSAMLTTRFLSKTFPNVGLLSDTVIKHTAVFGAAVPSNPSMFVPFACWWTPRLGVALLRGASLEMPVHRTPCGAPGKLVDFRT